MTALISRAFALSLALFVLPTLARAEKDAGAYLEAMMAGYEQPFSMAFEIEMAIRQSGMEVAVDGTGDILWADQMHSEMTMAMNMTMPGTNAPMAMAIKTVADGTIIWTEIENPMMGTQVMQVPVADAQAQAAQQGMGASFGQNPLEQLKTMQKHFDFEVEGIADGKVTLSGDMREGAAPVFGSAGVDVDRMVIVLDESTGNLDHMTLGTADAPLMTLRVRDYQRVEADDVPPSRFQYTPPEGALTLGAPESSGSG